MSTARIDGIQYTVHVNSKRPETTGALLSDYLESAEGGPFRFNQLCDKVCSLLVSLDVNNSAYFKEAASLLRSGWSMTIIPGIPGFIARAYGAVSSLVRKSSTIPGEFSRKMITAVQETATCVSALAYASTPFLRTAKETSDLSKKIMKGAEVSTFVADACDFVKNSQDAMTASVLANRAQKLGASEEFKEAIVDTRNFHVLKIMKSVCSLSSFICGLSAVSAYCTALPARAVIAATVSLAATLLSVGSSLYEKGMKYERVKFFSDKHVQQIARPEPLVKKLNPAI